MATAKDVALYFLKKDKEKVLFGFELISLNESTFYKGNARLNKYLHLSQNLYLAKYGEPLFVEKLFAYNNGAVVPSVQKSYRRLRTEFSDLEYDLSLNEKKFLDKMFSLLKHASIDELIELSHEDDEWEIKNQTPTQVMDSISQVDKYNAQYADALHLLEMV